MEVELSKTVTITMSEFEAKWLKSQMQNSPAGIAENQQDKTVRSAFWDALDDAGITS